MVGKKKTLVKKHPKQEQARTKFRVSALSKTKRSKQIKPFEKKAKPKLISEKQQKVQMHLRSQFKRRTKRKPTPPHQRVWRKTIVRIKPKAKYKLPRLFRMDALTGLPLDYERTVDHVMHYVNPHLARKPNPEQEFEQMLTDMFVEFIQESGRTHLPGYSQMKAMLRHEIFKADKRKRDDNQELDDFHCACKRAPIVQVPYQPTYRSKFNYNDLKLKSI